MACGFNFPTADESREIADLRAVQAEVCALQVAILDAREAGQREVTVCDTPMTMSTDYWQAWQDGELIASCEGGEVTTLLDRMDAVICYFQELGYSITRVTNDATGDTFCWVIKW
jgi:hypothetical protein